MTVAAVAPPPETRRPRDGPTLKAGARDADPSGVTSTVPTAGPTAGPTTAIPATVPTPARWHAALTAVLADPRQPVLHAQPIVDLAAAQVAGHELLSRFPRDIVDAPPDVWFREAAARGMSAALQARVLRRAFTSLDGFPPHSFVTVNVDPDVIHDDAVVDALTSRPRLDRFVVELTEGSLARDPAVLASVLDEVRARGAMVAVDDAGSGYSGLNQLLTLRADLVKVDRDLVSGIDADPVKRAMVAMLGELCGQMDAWMLCEGIETAAELEVLLEMGVPLGQGYHLGRPAAAPVDAVSADVAVQVYAASARAATTGTVASMVRSALTESVAERSLTDAAQPRASVRLDARGRPTHVRDDLPSVAGVQLWRPATVIAPTTSIADAAMRAVSRPAPERTAPLVATDDRGAVLGTVTLTDLVVALARSRSPDS